MPTYRVPVVVFTEVEGADYGDAANVAEHAISYLISSAATGPAPIVLASPTGRTIQVTKVSEVDRSIRTTDHRVPGLEITDIRGREVTE